MYSDTPIGVVLCDRPPTSAPMPPSEALGYTYWGFLPRLGYAERGISQGHGVRICNAFPRIESRRESKRCWKYQREYI
ncbi:MAG: hypothetical protein F6K16_34415 [Symploca sp. SIO2B6]|nr:hypothetical protein [Symploca sp. SIO2B6]